ncbi:hypothetical protein VFPBJ_04840 [Purpureocillium lilacinum]|uniref:Uncharacterized protein n=1 Tax=Purpureocillium lilacinum TaxID=33203 RepID=A0A179GWA5_PURLI|nr:hypothetical protein VFPBJ_04840 [Purpureocillium lilacinum]
MDVACSRTLGVVGVAPQAEEPLGREAADLACHVAQAHAMLVQGPRAGNIGPSGPGLARRPGPRPSHVPKRSRAWTGWAFVPSRKPRQWHRPRQRGQFEPVALHRGCWVDSAEPSMLFVWLARHARRCYSIGGTRRFCKAQDASSKQTKEQMARWIVPWHRRLGARKIGLRTRGGAGDAEEQRANGRKTTIVTSR